jgi:hypothetical protein
VLHTARLAARVEGVGPEGARDGLPDPLDEGLAEKGRALIAPWPEDLLPLRLVMGATSAYCWTEAASGKRSRRSPKTRAGAGQGLRQRPAVRGRGIVGQLGGELADLVVEAVDGSTGDEQEVGLMAEGSVVSGNSWRMAAMRRSMAV